MLRVFLASALLATSGGVAAQAVEDEIVVVARRIEQVTLILGRDGEGRTTCGLGRSSGDVRIDDAMCRRAARCVKRGPIVEAKIAECIDRQKRALAKAWARGERS